MAEKKAGFKVFKDQCLGSGAYGQVCKAKWYGLICAAKILHPTLNVRHQPGQLPQQQHRLPIERFEQEGRFMTALRHPNIVQYLGLCHDPDTGLDVILMELMDVSLTRYLESSPQPIPYHVQVNICHDVALALSFLHSNNVLHRDLSGNNILLTESQLRAKITDFGMARLGEVVPHRQSNTMCPGTDVYMPPEAVREQPIYSEKIDCFSFGVVVLQILTRQFPKPGNRQEQVEGYHPDYPGGTMMVCVPEIKRRQEHIKLVHQHHPLLCIALDCLRDSDGERPTAQQISERVAVLKQLKAYSDSNAQKIASEQMQSLQLIRLEENKKEIEHLRQLNWEMNQRLHEEKEREIQLTQQITNKDQVIRELREQLDHTMENYKVIKTKDSMIAEREQEIARLKQQILQLEQSLQLKDNRIRSNYQLAQQKHGEIADRDREIQQLRFQLQRATLSDKENGSAENEVKVKHTNDQLGKDQMPSAVKPERNLAAAVSPKEEECQIPESIKSVVSKPVDNMKLTWKDGGKAQRGLTRMCDAAVSANDKMVYILPFSTKDATVCKFEIATKSWSSLKSFPYRDCSLAVINDVLVIIGGVVGLATYINKLYNWTGEGDEGKWSTNLFPVMPTERANTSALVTEGNLLVVGGENSRGPLTVIEVMNIATHQWSEVASLPEALLNASMTACAGGDIYMLGGKNKANKSNKCVYICTLRTLLEKCDNPQNVWQKIKDSPNSDSTCVSLYGRLIAIGGTDSTARPSKDVFMYDSVSKSWKSVGKMSNDRHSCVAAVLPDNQVMVVGGWSGSHSKTDSVEFGSIE